MTRRLTVAWELGLPVGAFGIGLWAVLETTWPAAARTGQLNLALVVAAFTWALLRARRDGARAAASSTAYLYSALAVFLGSVRAAVDQCAPLETFVTGLVATLPAVWLAAALAALVSARIRSRALAAAFVTLALVANFLWAALPSYFGPDLLSFDHLGVWPLDDLRDASVSYLPPRAYVFRAQTLAIIGLLLAVSIVQPSRKALVRGTSATFAVALVLSEVFAPQIGLRTTDGWLRVELGALSRTRHFDIIHEPGTPQETMTQLTEELEFNYATLAPIFRPGAGTRVTVWLFPSEVRRRELVGGWLYGMFAKPWQRSMFIVWSYSGDPVIRHELAHVLAADWGSAPYGSTGGVFSGDSLLVEGLAEAFTEQGPPDPLHDRAAAFVRASDPEELSLALSSTSFYEYPPERSYAIAGSFVRFLYDTHGEDAVRVLYKNGEYQRALGISLGEAWDRWVQFLERRSPSEDQIARAQMALERASVGPACLAREDRYLAAANEARSDDEALALWAECERMPRSSGACAVQRAAFLSDRAALGQMLAKPTTQAQQADAYVQLVHAHLYAGDIDAASALAKAAGDRPRRADERWLAWAIESGAATSEEVTRLVGEAPAETLGSVPDDLVRAHLEWMLAAAAEAPLTRCARFAELAPTAAQRGVQSLLQPWLERCELLRSHGPRLLKREFFLLEREPYPAPKL